jgi:S1-C subfamily serine protease
MKARLKADYIQYSGLMFLPMVGLWLCLAAPVRAQVSNQGSLTADEVKSKPNPDNRNIVTFNDSHGRTYEDVEIVRVEPDGVAYLEADRIHAGKVKFADMSEAIREKLGYDPARATRHAQKQEEEEWSRLLAAERARLAKEIGEGKPAPGGPSRDSSPRGRRVHSGSGFFVTEDGCFLTCAHVTEGATRIAIKCRQGILPATLVKSDSQDDLALLKVSGSFRALPVARGGGVKLGDSVFTIGFPNVGLQGLEPKLTRGEISSLAGLQDDPRHFQISVAVQPGNSGGALVDSSGNVVGVVSMRLSELAALRTSGVLPQNVNYALKCDSITSFLEGSSEVSGKLKPRNSALGRKPEDVVKEVEDATALVIALRSATGQ